MNEFKATTCMLSALSDVAVAIWTLAASTTHDTAGNLRPDKMYRMHSLRDRMQPDT